MTNPTFFSFLSHSSISFTFLALFSQKRFPKTEARTTREFSSKLDVDRLPDSLIFPHVHRTKMQLCSMLMGTLTVKIIIFRKFAYVKGKKSLQITIIILLTTIMLEYKYKCKKLCIVITIPKEVGGGL